MTSEKDNSQAFSLAAMGAGVVLGITYMMLNK